MLGIRKIESIPHPVFTKKQLWHLLLPLMIEQTLTCLMGTVDTMMVGNAGQEAISAVALVDSINILVTQFFTSLAIGGSVACSQHLGRGSRSTAQEAGRQLFLSVAALSVLLSVLCEAFASPLLHLIFGSVEKGVMENALSYFLITAASYPFLALYSAGAALFRADGNSRLPMRVAIISNMLNIAGNALTIFLLKWGAAGAALATLLSRIFSAVVMVVLLRKPKQSIVIRNYLSIRPDFHLIRQIMKVGIPNGVENGMFQFGKLIIQSTVSTLGTMAISAQAITSALELLTSNAALGIAQGLLTVVGQCVGAGEKEQAKDYSRRIFFYGSVACMVSGIIVSALVPLICRLSQLEPEAVQLTCNLTWLIAIAKTLIWVPAFMPCYSFRGAGDARFTMIVSSTTMWVCRVAFTVLLVRVFNVGLLGVWLGMFFDWFIRGCIYFPYFFKGKWLNKRVID